MLLELQFLREISQLKQQNKRILVKIWQQLKVKELYRNQVLVRQGEPSRHVFIVKKGELSLRRSVYKQRFSELENEQNLLKNQTTTIKRFNNNFSK